MNNTQEIESFNWTSVKPGMAFEYMGHVWNFEAWSTVSKHHNKDLVIISRLDHTIFKIKMVLKEHLTPASEFDL